MKVEYFRRAVAKYQKQVRKAVQRGGVSNEHASEAFQSAVATLLKNKVYRRLEFDCVDGRIFNFLKTTTRNQIRMMCRRKDLENETVLHVEDDYEDGTCGDLAIENARDEMECPYCHSATLKKHGPPTKLSITCSACHTVLGQGRRERAVESVSEDDLAYTPDMDLRVDVADAMNQLEPMERKVIIAVVNQNETLEGFADQNGMAYTSLCRVYVRAKKKLQAALVEYA